MAELESPSGILPPIPDDLTLVQFVLDYQHSSRPVRNHEYDVPWIIEDRTREARGLEELRTRAFGLANGLNIRFNIKEDDVFLVFSPNHLDYLVAVWAIHRLGAVMSGANPSFTSDELRFSLLHDPLRILLNCRRNHIVLFDTADTPLTQGVFPTVRGLIDQGLSAFPSFRERRLSPGEGKTKVAFLNFSSGTTGMPKPIAIPHYAPIANIIQLAVHNRVNDDRIPWEDQRFRPGDVCSAGGSSSTASEVLRHIDGHPGIVLPLYHIYGMVFNAHYILFCGMTVVLTTGRFNFLDFLDTIVKYRITHLMLVPPQVVMFCKHPAVSQYDFGHVRYVTCGAAPLSREVMNRLMEVFPNASAGQSYGSLLAFIPNISCGIHDSRDYGVVYCDYSFPGRHKSATPVEVAVSFYRPGELVVKTPSLSLGYAGNPEATRETWFRTGDEVKMNKRGEVFVLDRLKYEDSPVAPAELEGCVLGHPDVEDTCVVGIPDEYSGELPVAFVVLRQEAGKRAQDSSAAHEIKSSIAKHVSDHKAAYKRLARVEFVDSIPKNPSGKLLRRVLRDRARRLEPRGIAKL
ncbi:hypothetical protein F5J12DRAFT_954393 [Pisolithus orientalis]|uniref:uncharacterized protein n=1 Tax=Pisolithus orientalis TaxID=936130 RepID=UPI002224343E|nr:uncharacterized protein F5J12DRAFT_954393 [Pisolithus orientalis]KAI6030702.1 hypothetical protein F5J12DRAFT_954393 [Pisolithus orientalis]